MTASSDKCASRAHPHHLWGDRWEGGAVSESPPFDAPRPDWCELWEGPLRYSATIDGDRLGPGHSLEQINEWGKDPCEVPVYRVSLDLADGGILIEWLVTASSSPKVKYYDGGPTRAYYDKLRDDPVFRHQELKHLPIAARDHAAGAFAAAVRIRECLHEEFGNAIRQGQARIWARQGSESAAFAPIPAEVFRAYTIQSWGLPKSIRGPKSGVSYAELDGAEPLYSIYVAPSDDGGAASRIARALQELPSSNGRVRRGRTKGSGSYASSDAPLLEEMRVLIAERKAFSPEGAAKLVASKAAGNSTEESKATRLAKRYRRSEKNSGS